MLIYLERWPFVSTHFYYPLFNCLLIGKLWKDNDWSDSHIYTFHPERHRKRPTCWYCLLSFHKVPTSWDKNSWGGYVRQCLQHGGSFLGIAMWQNNLNSNFHPLASSHSFRLPLKVLIIDQSWLNCRHMTYFWNFDLITNGLWHRMGLFSGCWLNVQSHDNTFMMKTFSWKVKACWMLVGVLVKSAMHCIRSFQTT